MKGAFFAAVIAIVIRLVMMSTGHPPEPPQFMTVHLLALVLIPFFSAHALLRAEPTIGFPYLFKEAFRTSALYVLVFCVFLFFYYKFVDVTYFPIRLNALIDEAIKNGHTEVEARERFGNFLSPFSYASISFFLMLLLSGVNSLVMGMLHHKVLRKIG